MFGWKELLSATQTAEIAAAKQVIYEGFKAAVAGGVPKEKAGILVDEQFGAAILRDASAAGFAPAVPAERSWQDEFDFQYGTDFARHIEAFRPSFCKVLVRYNPEGDRALNQRQAGRLKRLFDYLAEKGESRFMFELLVPAEKAQLDRLEGDEKAYDLELRPRLMVKPSVSCRRPVSSPTSGRSKVSTGARIARGSWRRRGPGSAIRSAASSSAAARMIARCGNGSELLQV
jgi:myo-inositol catabolism protein IolC